MNDDLHTLAAAYALDALEADERAEFEQHLTTCDACTTDVREMTATTAQFALAESSAPPTDLRERVLALAQQTQQVSEDSTVVPLRRRETPPRLNQWLAGVAAVAIVVAGALGITTYQANQRADDLQATAAQVNSILTDPGSERLTADVAGGGTGTFIVSRGSEQGVLVTAGIPPVSDDQTYQLWAINDAGAKSVGLYDVSEAGDGTKLVEFPDTATTFGMTVEPAEGSAEPTTEPVLLLPLEA